MTFIHCSITIKRLSCFQNLFIENIFKLNYLAISHGLVIKADGSWPSGSGLESRHRWMDVNNHASYYMKEKSKIKLNYFLPTWKTLDATVVLFLKKVKIPAQKVFNISCIHFLKCSSKSYNNFFKTIWQSWVQISL